MSHGFGSQGKSAFQECQSQVSNVAERPCNMDCALTIGPCIVEVLGCLGKTLSMKWWDKSPIGVGRRKDWT